MESIKRMVEEGRDCTEVLIQLSAVKAAINNTGKIILEMCIRDRPKNGEPRVLPIYQSTTFKYATSEEMGKLFDLEEEGYFYSRLQNPTNDVVAQKICDLEGGVAAMLTSSCLLYTSRCV